MPPNRWPGGSIPSGVPYEDLPITNPHCNTDSCHAFAAGWNESYRETSLISQIDYGFWVLCYYLSWTVLFVVAYSIHLIRDHLVRRDSKGNAPTQHPDWKSILVARYRSVAYRRFTGRLSALPSFGILSLFSVSTVFCACLIFPEQPYLRSHFRFGSPPLSVRCALCIAALMPLLIALGGKVNLITVATGVCYTKLSVFHRYVGGVIFALSTIHVIPHMYAPVKDGGVAYLAQLYIDQKRELSGTILYFLFIWLMLLSLPWVRRRAHEFFVCSHVFLGVSFIGILAWHIKGEYISPVYMYVTVGVLLIQSILRLAGGRTITGYPTTIEPLPCRVTKVTIEVPPSFRWRPGHHAFLRMLHLSVLDNHPFTIASVPDRGGRSGHRLVFLVRAHAGFTARLSAAAAKPPAAPPLVRTLVAGGTGITAVLPWALHLAGHMAEGGCRLRAVRLAWIVREVDCVRWVGRELIDAVNEVAGAGAGRRLVVDVYVTGGEAEEKASAGGRGESGGVEGRPDSAGTEASGEGRGSGGSAEQLAAPLPCYKAWRLRSCSDPSTEAVDAHGRTGAASAREEGGLNMHYGRPSVAQLLPTLLSGTRAFVLGCGPESMKVELSNAVAELQLDMVVKAKRMQSIVLHTEAFGW
ncbi:hypothetical protein B0J12DRAFT_746610 [Macrophomina phaseolina]|uniref:ferric-chelate reductase (NADPH) n=1 Tax=Macrophomina phaseolina TaxID=35725 RepID=A0ABQ8FS39_9PEZI|nr:hypothetical protein B0J12DRAFT_746610 [Macrophomina phaseolina]